MATEYLNGHGEGGGLVVVLDYPSKLNWSKKKHMWGEEERLIKSTIKACGLGDLPFYVTYGVPHPVDKKPTPDQMTANHNRLIAELDTVRPTKVLCMGMYAYGVLTNTGRPTPIDKIRGKGQWLPLIGRSVYMVTTVPVYYVTGNPQRFRDFATDIQKLASSDQPQPPVKIDLKLVRTASEWGRAQAILSKATVLSCDLETTGFNPRLNPILAFGLGALYPDKKSGLAVVILPEALALPEVRESLYEFMAGRSARQQFVFHNGKFDLKFLIHYFGRPMPSMWLQDTILMNYLLDERPFNAIASPHGLKTLSRVRYDAEDYKIDFKAFFAQSDEERDYQGLYTYLGYDLIYTLKLYFDLREEMEEESPNQWDATLWHCYRKLLIPATFAFAEIEYLGALVDRQYLEDLQIGVKDFLDQILTQSKSLLKELGVAPEKADKFNPNSYKQVQEMLLEALNIRLADEDGKDVEFSTDKDSLQALRLELERSHFSDKARLIELILKYREQSKVSSTYIKGTLDGLDSEDRIHADFNVNGTATGRLSCQNPNLQNIPTIMGPVIRKAYVAPEDYVFAEIDFSQLELRVAAWYSQDPIMIGAYVDKRDIHKEVAAAAFGVPYEEVTYDQRYAAKYIDFGVIYGRSAHSLAVGPELIHFGWTDQQAQKFIDDFLGQFEGLKKWILEIQKFAVQNHHVTTPTGRRRRWPLITDQERGHMMRQAVNTPIQGYASDITLNSLVQIHQHLRSKKSKVVLTVHDSIGLQIHKDEIDEVCAYCVEIMTKNLPVSCNVPIQVDVEIGPNWGELEKWKPQNVRS